MRREREANPRWSPDGTRVVYEAFEEGVGYGVMLVDVDGGSPTALVTDMAAGYPTWSPDGQQIGFIGACNDPRARTSTRTARSS